MTVTGPARHVIIVRGVQADPHELRYAQSLITETLDLPYTGTITLLEPAFNLITGYTPLEQEPRRRPADPLTEVEQAAAARDRAKQRLTDAIRTAREDGYTLAEIGAAHGVTAEATRQHLNKPQTCTSGPPR